VVAAAPRREKREHEPDDAPHAVKVSRPVRVPILAKRWS
jgi:hypothetical protein